VRDWLTEADVAAFTAVLTCCLLVWKLSTRWKHRFGTFGSALIKTPAYRALFVLVLIGVLLIGMLPEAAFVLPTLDTVGLDVVTILVAFELRHYLFSVARLVGGRTSANGLRGGVVPIVSRCLAFVVAPTKPEMLPHTCAWLLVACRSVMGSVKVPPQAYG